MESSLYVMHIGFDRSTNGGTDNGDQSNVHTGDALRELRAFLGCSKRRRNELKCIVCSADDEERFADRVEPRVRAGRFRRYGSSDAANEPNAGRTGPRSSL